MQGKKWFCRLLIVLLVLTMTGCADDGTGVFVQSVRDLGGNSGIAPGDRFAGLVVSENVTEISKDPNKSVAELLVKTGDDVEEGQELFSYDTDELQLALDKQKLELEQLQAMADNYTDQIEDLEEEREYAYGSDQLQYTVQIQTLQVDLKETELNIEAKKKEITQSEAILENAVVVSPVAGRIQSISESGTDPYGNPTAYITIQQAGSYRIKGMLGELQLGAIMEGSRIRILSRTDESQVWYGTVSMIDYENASQGNDSNIYYGYATDAMTTASRYPFYIELESTQGLILGQHVYLELDMGEADLSGLQLQSAFIAYDENGAPFVWAENAGKLEKRPVTLGEYAPATDTFTVLDGLTEADFVAFPDDTVCVEGAATTHVPAATESEVQP